MSLWDALGGLGTVAGAGLQLLKGFKEADAMDQRAKELKRQREAAALEKTRADQRRAEEADRARGALRARMAAQGVTLGVGTAGLFEDEAKRQADQEQGDADKLYRMERDGYRESIDAAKSGAGMALAGGFLGGLSSFGSGLGDLRKYWGF